MRIALAVMTCAVILVGLAPAQAEKRIFIVSNNAGSYGTDRCLADGQTCGAAAATAYCQSHEFKTAESFHKVDRDDITGAVPTSSGTCRGGHCDEFVAIECTR